MTNVRGGAVGSWLAQRLWAERGTVRVFDGPVTGW